MHLVGFMDTPNKIRKPVGGSLPPPTAVVNREAELIKMGSLKMYTLAQVPHLVECRQLQPTCVVPRTSLEDHARVGQGTFRVLPNTMPCLS